jgi:hypothetical protein
VSLVESERFASALDLDTYEQVQWRPPENISNSSKQSLEGDGAASAAAAAPIPPRRRKHLQKECYKRLRPNGLQEVGGADSQQVVGVGEHKEAARGEYKAVSSGTDREELNRQINREMSRSKAHNSGMIKKCSKL